MGSATVEGGETGGSVLSTIDTSEVKVGEVPMQG